jgi:AraC-like DNA-binding protein
MEQMKWQGAPAGAETTRASIDWRSLAARSDYRPARLAELCQLSLRHLERKLKLNTGTTPRRWLKQERLRRALDLLRDSQSAKEVAHGLGYRQCSQFSREFKLGFGFTPTKFRLLPRQEQDRLLAVANSSGGSA